MPQERTHAQNGGTIKKFGSVTDPYLPEEGLHKSVCRICHLVYQKKHWCRDDKTQTDENIHLTICPACQKIRDHYPEGYLVLSGGYLNRHGDEITRIVQNEAKRAEEKNPLQRIIDFNREKDGGWLITTTDEKLAQHLGREIHKAHSGKIEYHFGEHDKIARVYWSRDAA